MRELFFECKLVARSFSERHIVSKKKENTSAGNRRLRGGSFTGSNLGLQSLNGVAGVGVNQDISGGGFRVTSLAPIVVPEPSTYAMILGGLGFLITLVRRRGL